MNDPKCKKCKGSGRYWADPALVGTAVSIKCYCEAPPAALWEILVPTVRNNGNPFRTRYHRIWDAKVREITGGLTILPVAKGQWVHGEKLFRERMIPVRIYATHDQMQEIIKFSLKYYDQIAIMAYKVADEVLIQYRSEQCPSSKKSD